MRTQVEGAARKSLRRTLMEARRNDIPLVLLGSYARGKATPALSDIDVLVLGDHGLATMSDPVHVVSLSQEQLAERVRGGDDFAQWALRFGVPLTCRDEWAHLAEKLLENAPWPSAQRKLDQLARRLDVAEDLLRMGDVDAASEEAGSALNLVARARLLNAGEYPFSTPELPDQLCAIGDDALAAAIGKFRSGAVTAASAVQNLIELIRAKAADVAGAAAPNSSNGLSNEPRRTEPDGAGRGNAELASGVHGHGSSGIHLDPPGRGTPGS